MGFYLQVDAAEGWGQTKLPYGTQELLNPNSLLNCFGLIVRKSFCLYGKAKTIVLAWNI